jgi:2-dehydro-3-deoxygalactonokinase
MIAIDWGTSSLRAFRLDNDGGIVDARRSTQGILAAAGRFDAVLKDAVDGWPDALIVMCGMVGSRQGWHEVPYLECPAGLDQIAGAMVQLAAPTLPERDLWIVPGLTRLDVAGNRDVMRGEETQACGALSALGGGTHSLCLPGTHSKHVKILDGRIEQFHTAMTGELFDVLCTHSLLGRLMQHDAPYDRDAFLHGVDDARLPHDLLAHLFAVRSNGLFGLLPAAAQPSYLSGLLVGHELNDVGADVGMLHVLASANLLCRYGDALKHRNIRFQPHDESTAALGLHTLASRRNLL